MIPAKKAAKVRQNVDVILKAAFVLDDLPNDPNMWSPSERNAAADAILALGAPESFLRRFARSELIGGQS